VPSVQARRRGRFAAGRAARPLPARAGGKSWRLQFAAASLGCQIGISNRSAELKHLRMVGDGGGLGGTHGRRIWHGRYRRICCWGFLGRLCLCLSRGSSGRGRRDTSKTPARGERRTAQAAWPDEGQSALFPEERRVAEQRRHSHNPYDAPRVRSRTIIVLAFWIRKCSRWSL